MERAWEWEVLHLGKYPEINDRYCLLLLVGRDGGKKGKSIWCFFFLWQHPFLQLTSCFFFPIFEANRFFRDFKRIHFQNSMLYVMYFLSLWPRQKLSKDNLICNFWCLKNCTINPFNWSLIFLWSRYYSTINILLLYILFQFSGCQKVLSMFEVMVLLF